jgi:uncharacterized radical SAM superfamily Fe-S cluster-containing enzyme
MPNRPYLFYELTNSICSTCLRKVEAKVIIENEKVYLLKNCLQHGREKVLISTDVAYYKWCREFIKLSEMPYRTHRLNTAAPMIVGSVRTMSSIAA